MSENPASPSSPRSPRSDQLTWCAEAPRESSFALFVDGNQLATRADRQAALEKLRAGQLTRLEIEAVAYIQTAKPNRNFVRFKPGMMPSFAKSFTGQPFLRDHASRDLMARGGTILSSKLEHLDPADGDPEADPDGAKDKQIRMRIELVKAWAIEAALDGTLDRFSIGWSRTGPIMCSACEASIAKCYHWPGDQLDDGRTVEFIFTAADGTELSGVNVPAVVGTGIEAISLRALDRSELLGTLEVETEQESNTMEKLVMLCTVLGISATSTADEAIREVEKLRDERDEAVEERDELKAKAKENEKLAAEERLAAEKKLEIERKAAAKTKISELVKAGKLKPGGSKRQERLEKLAVRDFDDFLAQCEEMLESDDRVTPVGAKLPALANPPGEKVGEAVLAENPHLAPMLRSAGITEEQWQKHGAGARAHIEQKRAAGYGPNDRT